jgi:uncharacterized protein DUF6527
MKRTAIKHEFVEFIPEILEEGMLYVSIPYATAVHKCCCDCGREVVTPLSPTDWELRFDGKTISLDPSIGSWALKCQSHYWIRHDRVVWARRWSRKEIEQGRARERREKEGYFGGEGTPEKAGRTGKRKSGGRLYGK